MPLVGAADEEVVKPTPLRGKRQPLSAELPRIEVMAGVERLACMPHARRKFVDAQKVQLSVFGDDAK